MVATTVELSVEWPVVFVTVAKITSTAGGTEGRLNEPPSGGGKKEPLVGRSKQ